MSRSLALMTAAVLALSVGAAHAEDKPHMTVKVSDLNLAFPKDAHRLYDRVSEAARQVCGLPPLAFFVAGPPPEFLVCRDATIDAALSQIHAPLVQALRKGQTNDQFASAQP